MPIPKGTTPGRKFSTTYQPKIKGRRPSVLKKLDKVYMISSEDRKKWYSYLLSLSVEELEVFINDKSLPIWQVELARFVYKSVAKNDLSVFRELQDRFFGRATESIDVTSKGRAIIEEPLTIEIIDRREQVRNTID
ncbi:MAG: hypothetical protein J5382_04615 [Bacteroidales bacterium]|nr:hypothetical protein [Bacteroidales bacterium]